MVEKSALFFVFFHLNDDTEIMSSRNEKRMDNKAVTFPSKKSIDL